MLAFRRASAVPVYLVDVVKHRPLSRALAERLGVTHASPQAIILKDGVPAWHRSHFDIEAEAMRRVVSHLSEDGPGQASGERLSGLD
jgi:bacillithiol system protein YtxJ